MPRISTWFAASVRPETSTVAVTRPRSLALRRDASPSHDRACPGAQPRERALRASEERTTLAHGLLPRVEHVVAVHRHDRLPRIVLLDGNAAHAPSRRLVQERDRRDAALRRRVGDLAGIRLARGAHNDSAALESGEAVGEHARTDALLGPKELPEGVLAECEQV